jgi:hypothetical protein
MRSCPPRDSPTSSFFHLSEEFIRRLPADFVPALIEFSTTDLCFRPVVNGTFRVRHAYEVTERTAAIVAQLDILAGLQEQVPNGRPNHQSLHDAKLQGFFVCPSITRSLPRNRGGVNSRQHQHQRHLRANGEPRSVHPT